MVGEGGGGGSTGGVDSVHALSATAGRRQAVEERGRGLEGFHFLERGLVMLRTRACVSNPTNIEQLSTTADPSCCLRLSCFLVD